MGKIKDSDLIYHLINSMNLLIHIIDNIKEEDYKKYIDKDTKEFIEEITDANYDLANEIMNIDLLEINEMINSLNKNLDNIKIKVIKKESKENGRK